MLITGTCDYVTLLGQRDVADVIGLMFEIKCGEGMNLNSPCELSSHIDSETGKNFSRLWTGKKVRERCVNALEGAMSQGV